jgi:hypothetical protein
MQKRFLSGLRLHYQKPFSLFAISATFGALVLFLIYHDAKEEINQFYKHYYFIVQAVMLPLYALITYLLFKSPKLYYAEALVMNVYMLGFMSVCIVPINVVYLLFPEYIIQKLEVVFLISYNTWTFLNFFKGKPVMADHYKKYCKPCYELSFVPVCLKPRDGFIFVSYRPNRAINRLIGEIFEQVCSPT